jgi:hypothetical protein
VAGSNGSNNGASHLDWVRARHNELSAERYTDVPIPGYQGRLAFRFGPVPWRVVKRSQDLIAKDDADGRGALAANMDVLISACRDVLADGAPIDDAGPTRIDAKLAELVKSDTKTARELLAWLFGPNEIGIGVMAGELVTWSQEMHTETAEELVSE